MERTENPTSTTPMPEAESHYNQKLGLQTCVEPMNPSQAVDIVFVHGLTGDRKKSWTHQANACFWPEALLPNDIPEARVCTYGYDADVTWFWLRSSQSRIADHAQTLLGDVVSLRERTETVERPLFFVAHSLGGLVVEDMLLKAKNSADDDMQRVLESTRGIAFLGTPHCGAKLADWAKILTSVAKLLKRSNDSMVAVMRPESEVLARIQQEFHTMIRARDDAGKPKWRIICFYEDLNTLGIGGPVVPKESAILSRYKSIAIPADHEDMSKFSQADDVGYKRVADELWKWVRDIKREHQMPQPGAWPASPSSGLLLLADPSTGNSFRGSINDHGHVLQGNNCIGTMTYGGR